MKVHPEADQLVIELGGADKLWCCTLRPITVSRNQLLRVADGIPETSWTDFRAPGTSLPGIIRAGTYYTRRGKEFWCVRFKRDRHIATLELEGHRYRRLILSSPDTDIAALIRNWCAWPPAPADGPA